MNKIFMINLVIFFIYSEESRSVTTGVVQGQPAMFRVAREDAVRQICEKLKQKLDEFLELENYDWLLIEPKGHASSYISDIIAFLQTTFQSFTNIPVSCKIGFTSLANLFDFTPLNYSIAEKFCLKKVSYPQYLHFTAYSLTFH